MSHILVHIPLSLAWGLCVHTDKASIQKIVVFFNQNLLTRYANYLGFLKIMYRWNNVVENKIPTYC